LLKLLVNIIISFLTGLVGFIVLITLLGYLMHYNLFGLVAVAIFLTLVGSIIKDEVIQEIRLWKRNHAN
jgi:hypothetical protein